MMTTRISLAILLSLGIVCLNLLAGENSQGPIPLPYVHESSGLQFPSSLGNLPRQEAHIYSQKDAGTALRYTDDEVEATVYIYTRGLKGIPDGAQSKYVRQELKNALNAVQSFQQTGIYANVKVFRGPPVPLGTSGKLLQWVRAGFTAEIGDTSALSLIYITATHNHFVKLRISSTESAHPSLKKFPRELGKLLSQQTFESEDT